MGSDEKPFENDFMQTGAKWTEVYSGHAEKTLRDEFAMAALSGIVATTTDDQRDITDWSIEASDAYAIADAMMAQRETGRG